MKKKSKHKAKFEPATFCSTHKSPNHYIHHCCCCCCQSLFPPYHRQTLETNPANHWQPIPNPPAPPIHIAYRLTLLTIGNPSQNPPAPPIHTAYSYMNEPLLRTFAPMLCAPPYGHSSTLHGAILARSHCGMLQPQFSWNDH